MEFEIIAHAHVVEMRLVGTLDRSIGLMERDAAVGACADPARCGLALDVSAVTHVDSHGFGFLISVYKNACVAGKEFALIAVPPSLRALLESTRLSTIMPIFGTVAEFEGSLGEGA